MPRRKHRQVEGPVSRTGQDQGRQAGSPPCAVWAPGASEGRGEPSGQMGPRALVAVTENKEPLWLEARGQRGGRPEAPWRQLCLSFECAE